MMNERQTKAPTLQTKAPTLGDLMKHRLGSMQPAVSHGLIEPGNIDLRRPSIPNPDGGMSTVYSSSFNINGKEVLLPLADEGRILSAEEAIDKYNRTGQHLGTFHDVASANAYAKQLHDEYEAGKYSTMSDLLGSMKRAKRK